MRQAEDEHGEDVLRDADRLRQGELGRRDTAGPALTPFPTGSSHGADAAEGGRQRTLSLTPAPIRFRLIVAGVLFGLATSAVNHGVGPSPEYVSKVLGNSWAWLTAGMLAVWPATSWRTAFRHGFVFLGLAVVGYYTADLFTGTYTTWSTAIDASRLDVQGLTVDMVFYLLAAVVASALLALLVLPATVTAWWDLSPDWPYLPTSRRSQWTRTLLPSWPHPTR